MNSRLFSCIAFRLMLCGLCLSASALADDAKNPIDQWLERAITKDSTTLGMRQATSEAANKWDAEMNRRYHRLMTTLNGKQHAALLQSQKAWLVYRDAEGKAIYSIVGVREGTVWPLVADKMWLEMVKQRALALKAYDPQEAIGESHE